VILIRLLGPAKALRLGEEAVGIYLIEKVGEKPLARFAGGFAGIMASVEAMGADAAAKSGFFWGHRQRPPVRCVGPA